MDNRKQALKWWESLTLGQKSIYVMSVEGLTDEKVEEIYDEKNRSDAALIDEVFEKMDRQRNMGS
jgi:hypothetical protein